MLGRLIFLVFRPSIFALSAFLAIWLGIPGQAIALPTPWTILDESGVRVVRSETENGWITRITVNGAPYADLNTVFGNGNHGLSVLVEFVNGTRVEYPAHFPNGTTIPYISLVTPSGTQQVALGTSAVISSSASLSVYGFVSININGSRIVVFATGILVASGSSSSVVVFPSGQNLGTSTSQVPSSVQTLLQSLGLAFATLPDMGGSIQAVSVTNYSGPSLMPLEQSQEDHDSKSDDARRLSDAESDFEEDRQTIECQDIPRCCCDETGLTPQGTCRNAYILVGGAGKGQGRADSSVGVVMSSMRDMPCHKNAFEFQYDTGDSPENNARKLASFSNRVAQTCGVGSTVDIDGMCNGGHVLWHALKYLDTEWFNFEVDFWNTPFFGGRTSVAVLANLVPFGIMNLLLDRAQFNIMYSTSPEGPRNLPPGIKRAAIHIGSDDDFLSEKSQRGPLNVPQENVKYYNAGHFDTYRNNGPGTLIECCGDHKVNGGEECEGEGELCTKTRADGTRVAGECQGDCTCKTSNCNDGVLQEGEACDKPGEVCKMLSWIGSDTYGHTATSICQNDCTCPPLVFPTPAPAAADVVSETTSHSSGY